MRCWGGEKQTSAESVGSPDLSDNVQLSVDLGKADRNGFHHLQQLLRGCDFQEVKDRQKREFRDSTDRARRSNTSGLPLHSRTGRLSYSVEPRPNASRIYDRPRQFDPRRRSTAEAGSHDHVLPYDAGAATRVMKEVDHVKTGLKDVEQVQEPRCSQLGQVRLSGFRKRGSVQQS